MRLIRLQKARCLGSCRQRSQHPHPHPHPHPQARNIAAYCAASDEQADNVLSMSGLDYAIVADTSSQPANMQLPAANGREQAAVDVDALLSGLDALLDTDLQTDDVLEPSVGLLTPGNQDQPQKCSILDRRFAPDPANVPPLSTSEADSAPASHSSIQQADLQPVEHLAGDMDAQELDTANNTHNSVQDSTAGPLLCAGCTAAPRQNALESDQLFEELLKVLSPETSSTSSEALQQPVNLADHVSPMDTAETSHTPQTTTLLPAPVPPSDQSLLLAASSYILPNNRRIRQATADLEQALRHESLAPQASASTGNKPQPASPVLAGKALLHSNHASNKGQNSGRSPRQAQSKAVQPQSALSGNLRSQLMSVTIVSSRAAALNAKRVQPQSSRGKRWQLQESQAGQDALTPPASSAAHTRHSQQASWLSQLSGSLQNTAAVAKLTAPAASERGAVAKVVDRTSWVACLSQQLPDAYQDIYNPTAHDTIVAFLPDFLQQMENWHLSGFKRTLQQAYAFLQLCARSKDDKFAGATVAVIADLLMLYPEVCKHCTSGFEMSFLQDKLLPAMSVLAPTTAAELADMLGIAGTSSTAVGIEGTSSTGVASSALHEVLANLKRARAVYPQLDFSTIAALELTG